MRYDSSPPLYAVSASSRGSDTSAPNSVRTVNSGFASWTRHPLPLWTRPFFSEVCSRIEHMFEQSPDTSGTEVSRINASHVNATGVDVSGIELDGLCDVPRTSGDLVDLGTLVGWLLAHPAEQLLEDYDVLEHALVWERVHTFAKAQVTESMVEFARRPEYVGTEPETALARRGARGEVVRRFPDDELAARFGVSSAAIDAQLDVALALARRLPATHCAFTTGALDFVKTRAMVRGCGVLDDEQAAVVEARLLGRAVDQDVTKLRQRIKRAVLRIDPALAEERRQRCLADRRVWITPADDGMAWLTALLPAADAMTIERAIDSAARTAKADATDGDERTLEQLRADHLVWPFTQALQHGVLTGPSEVTLARHRGHVPQINVTVAASTLMGLDDLPGELGGYGSITAETARGIASGGVWRRIVTDPASGTVLDVGTTTYQPPADLARHVEIRDQTCRYPTCNRPATRAELDHTVPFPDGSTSHDNLAVLCVHHHQLKHHQPDAQGTAAEQPSRLVQEIPGKLRWTMPTGHQYLVEPTTVGTIDAQQLLTEPVA